MQEEADSQCVNECCVWCCSAIQNAPNPGGGEQKPLARLSPLKPPLRKPPPCRGHSGCRSSCGTGEAGRSSGPFSAQIENTPILCPFHLQPVPEYESSFATLCCTIVLWDSACDSSGKWDFWFFKHPSVVFTHAIEKLFQYLEIGQM